MNINIYDDYDFDNVMITASVDEDMPFRTFFVTRETDSFNLITGIKVNLTQEDIRLILTRPELFTLDNKPIVGIDIHRYHTEGGPIIEVTLKTF